MNTVDDAIKQAVWEKGRIVPLKDSSVYRFDEQGALIKWEEYGNYTDFGWQIDHIYPESLLKEKGVPQDKIDDICNLRPLNSRNNDAKSNNYPVFSSVISYDSSLDNNVQVIRYWNVTEETQQRLSKFFGI